MENGTLATLTIRAYRASVPTNRILSTRAASRYSAITGPAAFATIVVNPAATPVPIVVAGWGRLPLGATGGAAPAGTRIGSRRRRRGWVVEGHGMPAGIRHHNV